MRVAVLIDSFPKLSEAFILNQITTLIDKKIDLTVFSKNQPEEKINEFFIKYQLKKITIYGVGRSKSNNYFLKIGRTFYLAIKLLVKRPILFFKLFFLNNSLFSTEYLYEVFTYFNQKPFDVIHAHFGPVGVRAVNLIKLGLLKGNIICSFHGYDVDRNDFKENPKIYYALFQKAKIITGNSQFTNNNIEKLGCPKKKLKYLPESLRTEYFVPFLKDEKKIINILTVARLVEFKGVEYSIKAIKALVDEGYKNIHYNIIGDGELANSLKKLVADLNMQDFITFYGSQTQDFILNKYKDSDIFLLTGIASKDGRKENQGLVIQEAQAMQLPVVVSDIGGIPEGILNNESGFLVAPGNISDIASKLKYLIQNPDVRIPMGIKGRQFVKEKFDSTVVSEILIKLYSKVISDKSYC